MVAIGAAGAPQQKSGAESKPQRANRYSAAEVHALKARDNVTNWKYLAHVYIVIAAALAAGIWAWSAAIAGAQSWWVSGPVLALAIVAIGAAQHQFGGAIHEGTHYMLFADRKLNELASDWLAAYPIYTTTYHFRLHHLAHHQFVNDPVRDPDISQLHDSDHWLDFPITHVEVAWKLLKQLWLPNLFRYTITRARYSALGAAQNPYADPDRPGSVRPLRAGILFAAGAPAICVPLVGPGGDDPRAPARRQLPDDAACPRAPAAADGDRAHHLYGAALRCAFRRRACRLGTSLDLFRLALGAAAIHDVPAVHDPAPMGAAR